MSKYVSLNPKDFQDRGLSVAEMPLYLQQTIQQLSQVLGVTPQAVMTTSLARSLQVVRRGLGLTAQELAVALGVSVTTISRWETGRSKPSKLAAVRLKELVKR